MKSETTTGIQRLTRPISLAEMPAIRPCLNKQDAPANDPRHAQDGVFL